MLYIIVIFNQNNIIKRILNYIELNLKKYVIIVNKKLYF